MRPIDQLTMMLTGGKKGKPKPDAAEERREKRMGQPDNPREEALEDYQGRPLKMRFPANRKKGR